MNEQDLAGLLGASPITPDPVFRFEVFKRIAERARRRAAYRRAARTVAVSSAVGVFFPLAQAAGFTLADAQPLFYTGVVVGLTYFLAREAVKGPHSVLARGLGQLRFRL